MAEWWASATTSVLCATIPDKPGFAAGPVYTRISTTTPANFSRLRQSLQQYRHWVEEERKVSADPVKHQAFLAVRKLTCYALQFVHGGC